MFRRNPDSQSNNQDIRTHVLTIQRRYRDKFALKKMKERAGIDLKRQSQINILELYHRLRHAEGLPEEIRQSIQKEKKSPHHVMTKLERKFFKKIIHKPIFINHATPSAQAILDSGYFYSTQTLRRISSTSRTHTSNAYGGDYFVYFSYGFQEKTNTVNFLGSNNFFLINLDELARNEPVHFASICAVGHFHAYDQEQISSPVVVQTKNDKIQINVNYQVTCNPLPKAQRHFHFNTGYHMVTQSLERKQEVSCGRHIKPFHALRLIEYLRFFPTNIRNEFLRSHNDKQIAELFDSLFTPGKAEIHIPNMQASNNNYTKLVMRNNQILFTELHKVISHHNDYLFKIYLQQATNAYFYRYSLQSKSNLSLLNIAVLEKQYEIVNTLLEFGFDPSIEYFNEKQNLYVSYALRTALQDAIEQKDFVLIKLLCEPRHPVDMPMSFMMAAIVDKIHLYAAIAENISEEIFHYLLKKYLCNGRSLSEALAVACFYDNTMAMQQLICAHADLHKTNKLTCLDDVGHIIPWDFEGCNPLYIAVIYGRVKAVKCLLQYKVDVNIPCQGNGYYELFGKGKSALIGLLEKMQSARMIDLLGDHHDNYSYGMRIDNPRYKKLPIPTCADYQEILELLLKAGADIHYGNGRHRSPFQMYLKNKDSIPPRLSAFFIPNEHAQVELEEEECPFRIYNHESYAIITTLNKHQKTMVLSACGAQYLSSESHWTLSGGLINYKEQKTLKEASEFYAAFQMGVDLTTLADSCDIIRHDYNENVIEIQLYKLNKKTHEIVVYSNTCDDLKLEHEYTMLRAILKLKNIQWIPLSEVVVTYVDYSGIQFPVFCYQDKPFPLTATMHLISLMGLQVENKNKIKDISFDLHFNGTTLVENVIKEKDLNQLIQLIKLRLNHFFDFSQYITTSFKSESYFITDYLLGFGLRLSDVDVMNGIFYQEYNKPEINHPEWIMLKLFDAHSAILSQYNFERFSHYAGRHNMFALAKKLLAVKSSYVSEVVKGAISNFNISSISAILQYALENNLQNEVEKALHGNLYKRPGQGLQELYLRFLQKITQIISSRELGKHLLCLLCSFYEDLIKNNDPLQSSCLSSIKMLAKPEHCDFKTADEVRGVLIRLNLRGTVSLSKEFTETLCSIPLMAFIFHAHNRSYEKMDEILAIHYALPDIIKYLLFYDVYEIHYKNNEKEVYLQHVVKLGALHIVNLLLGTCFNYDYFYINVEDAQGNTPLDNAILNGFHEIADLLFVHQAKTKKANYVSHIISPDVSPPTIDKKLITTAKKSSHIMCYGLIRSGNGFAHVLRLAELMKKSEDKNIKNKKIYIVGNVEKNARSQKGYDATLYKILCSMYPHKKQDFFNKSPDELIVLTKQLQDNESNLPIKLFLDVPDKKLPEIFEECEYAFHPAYRGATLLNSSMNTSLAFGCVVYSHITNTTPNVLQGTGAYAQGIVLVPNSEYQTYAANVLTDLQEREANKECYHLKYSKKNISYNQHTRDVAHSLYVNELMGVRKGSLLLAVEEQAQGLSRR